MSYAHRIDANQTELVQAFERLGCSVIDLSSVGSGCPDLAVSVCKVTVLVEIKTEDGTLEPSQIRFHRENKSWIETARNLEDVEDIVRRMRQSAYSK